MADYLKIPELARRLDVSEKTARRYIKGGALPSTFIGGAYRVTEEDLETFLRRAEVRPEDASPKAPAPPSSTQPPLNGFEEERREDIYTPWLEFIDRYTDRWEEKIANRALDRGAVEEFIATQEDMNPVLLRLGRQEGQENPDYPYTHGPIMNKAVGRLIDLVNPLIEAGVKQDEESDLEQLRRRREEFAHDHRRAASG